MENRFDFIIIGAGSAGCVLANRLSADEKNRVLILEAGASDKQSMVKIPAAFPQIFKSKLDYNYYTTENPSMKNRKMYLPRGRMLGGCSSSNAMIYIRGSKQDYDEWSSLGNSGWSYDEVLPYFKRSENQEIIDSDFHSKGGPLNVTNRNYTNLLSQVFIEAGLEMGFNRNEDFNGASQEGFGIYQVTHINGERCSAARAFLHPVTSRSNLNVEIQAEVAQIQFEGEQAKGVVYYQNGQRKEALVNKEIILSAGAYNSPKILMLSGIGDAGALKKHNIPLTKHLPGVGKNLQDHLVVFSIFNSSYKKTLDKAERIPYVFGNLLNYKINKKGPFNSNIGESGAFVKSSSDQPVPDIQFHFGPAYFDSHGLNNPTGGNGYSIGGKVLNPSSKGSVSLASSNYQDKPLIDHNYLSTEDDVRRTIFAFKLSMELGMTEAFKPYRKGLYLPKNPLADDLAIEDYCREIGETLYHPTSTCKMGNDEMAVVNAQLKVHGLKGLRVVDASIMPNVCRGNTNAPTIMIAEKASDMILASFD